MANKVSIDPRYLSYDTPEVEALLGKVENPDTTPTAESGNLITSGGVKTALDKKYEVPNGGIPSSDMAGNIPASKLDNESQSLLTAAGTALQYEENSDPMSLIDDSSDSSDSE